MPSRSGFLILSGLVATMTLIAAPFAYAEGAVVDATGLAKQLSDAPGRSAEDKARDAQRKPADVLAFLGLKKGDTVLDIWSSGGWYTEVLSIAVGAEGHVYSQNPPEMLKWNNGSYDAALAKRLADNRLANVSRVNAALSETDIQPGSIDFAITALNFHDMYNDSRTEAFDALKALHRLLSRNGVLAIVDHVGLPDQDNAKLHRIPVAVVKNAARSAGFVVDDESDLLANPADDHTLRVFDPAIRGKTDRFILRLRKE